MNSIIFSSSLSHTDHSLVLLFPVTTITITVLINVMMRTGTPDRFQSTPGCDQSRTSRHKHHRHDLNQKNLPHL